MNLIDVTIRDGGLGNNFSFTADEITNILCALVASNAEFIEVGYFKPNRWAAESGPGVCDEAYLETVMSFCSNSLRFVCMTHTWEMNLKHYKILKKYNMGMIRLPLFERNIDDIQIHCDTLDGLGIPYSLNIIRASECNERRLEQYINVIDRVNPKVIYLADSNGALYPEDLESQIKIISKFMPDLPLGFHAHDNIGLALANSLTAIGCGCDYLDSSLGGLGKGGGNLKTEIISMILNKRYAKEYFLDPIIQISEAVHDKWVAHSFEEKYISFMFGIENLNMNEVLKIKEESIESKVPVRQLIAEKYNCQV